MSVLTLYVYRLNTVSQPIAERNSEMGRRLCVPLLCVRVLKQWAVRKFCRNCHHHAIRTGCWQGGRVASACREPCLRETIHRILSKIVFVVGEQQGNPPSLDFLHTMQHKICTIVDIL